MTKPIKLVGYARVSSLPQSSGLSLSEQSRRIREFAKEIGAQLLAIREDLRTGGGDPLKRPDLKDALKQASDEHAGIIVTNVDRLARDPAILKILRKDRIDVWVVGRGKISRGVLKRELIEAEKKRTAISSRAQEFHMERKAKPTASKPRIDPAARRKGTFNNSLRASDRDAVIFRTLRHEPKLLKITHRELAEALNSRDLLNVKNMSGETQLWNKRSAGDLRRRFDKTIAFEHEMDLEDLKLPPMS